jgi:transposase, IS5 family
MAPHIRRGNATRSKIRAGIEHVFAHQKGPMALCIRTIGIVRAKVKIGLANLTYNLWTPPDARIPGAVGASDA